MFTKLLAHSVERMTCKEGLNPLENFLVSAAFSDPGNMLNILIEVNALLFILLLQFGKSTDFYLAFHVIFFIQIEVRILFQLVVLTCATSVCLSSRMKVLKEDSRLQTWKSSVSRVSR